jgi:phage regulator Rha-like protein
MDKLVFINSNNLHEEPYTTSKIISEYGGQKHHAIQALISTYEKDLKEFGKLSFKMRPLPSDQKEKIYKLNEQQATLLITYMKNTLPVRRFKKALVNQFFKMREELIKRRVERHQGINERNTLTDAIKRLPKGKYKDHLYSNVTRMIYKLLFNKTVPQLKKQFNVPQSGNLRDYLPKIELVKVKALENQAATLINARLSYQKIKETLLDINSITV